MDHVEVRVEERSITEWTGRTMMGGLAHYLHSHQSTYLHLAIPSSSWVLDLDDAGWQVETAGRSIDSTPVCVSFNKTDDDRAPSVSMDPCDPIISTLFLDCCCCCCSLRLTGTGGGCGKQLLAVQFLTLSLPHPARDLLNAEQVFSFRSV